jgi:4-hydroxy-tetrahydrodipicolinate reductase
MLNRLMSGHRILISGLPGAMAHETLRELLDSPDADCLLSVALSSDVQSGQRIKTGDRDWLLVGPSARNEITFDESVLAIDFSTPVATLPNAEWFCERSIPFVMGTTGGDEAAIREVVERSSISAVVAPNMAAPIILIQQALQHLADTFPGTLSDFDLKILESHQVGKRDTSGTAKAMLAYLEQLGLSGGVGDIEKVRDPALQREIGVPEEHLSGHAYHDYSISSRDGSVFLGLQHNVNGRRVYAKGAIQAARFLSEQISLGSSGQIFSMIDVLRGIEMPAKKALSA